MPIIEVNHVTKEYQLGTLKSIKQTARNALARLRGQQVEQHAPFKALDDLSFSVKQCALIGIIATNWAGKTRNCRHAFHSQRWRYVAVI